MQLEYSTLPNVLQAREKDSIFITNLCDISWRVRRNRGFNLIDQGKRLSAGDAFIVITIKAATVFAVQSKY